MAAILAEMFVSGCTNVQPAMDIKKIYQRDLTLSVESWNIENQDYNPKVNCYGFCLVDKARRYRFTIKAPGNDNYYAIKTCHRNYKVDSTFIYEPAFSLETDDVCPLEVIAADKNGETAWSIIYLPATSFKMSSILRCNGSIQSYNGVSICQSAIGLLQEISFDKPVAVAADKTECETIVSEKDTNIITFKMAKGKCTYFFMDLKDETKVHRLNTFGFEAIR